METAKEKSFQKRRMDKKVKLTNPKDSKIEDVAILPRIIHFDESGFLVETMRKDDKQVSGQNFAMSYISETPPGVARDPDKWHHHQNQVDRFVCVRGRIALALYDGRETSSTKGSLEVIDLVGAQDKEMEEIKKTGRKKDKETYIVTIPEGVYHCYKNIGDEDCILVNFPTQLYNSRDEGRTLFKDVPISSLGGKLFSWELLEV